MHIKSVPMCTCVRMYQDNELTFEGVGSSNNYAYIVTDESTKEGVIIDPANPEEYV